MRELQKDILIIVGYVVVSTIVILILCEFYEKTKVKDTEYSSYTIQNNDITITNSNDEITQLDLEYIKSLCDLKQSQIKFKELNKTK